MDAFTLRAGPPPSRAECRSRHRGLRWLVGAQLVAALAQLVAWRTSEAREREPRVSRRALQLSGHFRHAPGGALGADLRHAIEHGEIVAHYQPQVDVRDGRVVGCEALARWRHPERGEIAPTAFIPLAERSGLIGALTAHVLRVACTDALRWRRADPRLADLVVSVNLSPRAIDDALPAMVERVLAETGMPAERICLEVTETAVVDRAICHIALGRLKQVGVRLAIDDFGVGQSSLSQLARLGRLDRLKIDKALIDDICESPTASRVTRAIIDVARADGLDIVAEGVEHPAQLAHLRELSCPIIQGWLYSRALHPGDFMRYASAGLSSGAWSAQTPRPAAATTPHR